MQMVLLVYVGRGRLQFSINHHQRIFLQEKSTGSDGVVLHTTCVGFINKSVVMCVFFSISNVSNRGKHYGSF